MTNLIRVATFNTFGIPIITPNPIKRMGAIGQAFAKLNLDIIGFQEVFTKQHSEALLESLQPKYSCYFGRGAFGSGLLLVARFPIENIKFYPYSLKGKVERIYHGSYLITPGLAIVTLQTPWGVVDVLNTHLIANFSRDQYDEYFTYRCAQIFELSEFASQLSPKSPKIILGDFNILPESIEHNFLKELLQVQDVWSELYPGENTPTVSIENMLVKARKPHLRKSEKIDYVFYKNGQTLSINPIDISLSMQETFTDNHGRKINFSDHYAVEAELELNIMLKDKSQYKALKPASCYRDLISIFSSGISEAKHRQRVQLTYGILSIIGLLMFSMIIWRGNDQIKLEALSTIASGVLGIVAFLSIWIALTSTQAEIRILRSFLEHINQIMSKTISANRE